MTHLNTIIEEEKKEFDSEFAVLFEEVAFTGGGHSFEDITEEVKNFLTTAMQRAYEAGQSEERAKIREEVEKDRLPVDGEMVDEARLVRKSFNAGLDAVLAKLTPDKTPEI